MYVCKHVRVDLDTELPIRGISTFGARTKMLSLIFSVKLYTYKQLSSFGLEKVILLEADVCSTIMQTKYNLVSRPSSIGECSIQPTSCHFVINDIEFTHLSTFYSHAFSFLQKNLAEAAEEGRCYDTLEQPVWKSYRKYCKTFSSVHVFRRKLYCVLK